MTTSHIPFNGVDRLYKDIKFEVLDEIDKVMLTGHLLNGYKKAQFEDQMACRLGREYAICVNSGTNALHYILDYYQSGIADYMLKDQPLRIAAPNFTFKSMGSVVADRGETVWTDVDGMSGLIDMNDDAFNRALDIVIYVNLYGNMINYEELITRTKFFSGVNKHTKLIEDACQSFGATFKGKPSGSFGNFSFLSFDPTKNLPNFGGGGMILTDNHKAAGWLFNYLNNNSNYPSGGMGSGSSAVNSTMSEVDCAGMLIKLKHFDKWQARRKEIAEYYNDNLHDSIVTPRYTVTEDVEHAWHKYVILTDKRSTLCLDLENENIESKIHYAMGGSFLPDHLYPGTRAIGANCLSLPIYPHLLDVEVERIVEVINKAMNNRTLKLSDSWDFMSDWERKKASR